MITWLRRLKIENVLPLSIWAIGLVISYVHIYRAALNNPALAEVAWAIPALFDLLVVFAAYVTIRRVREGHDGWSAIWPATIAGIGLFASLWINTDYVQPANISEYMLTWAAVIGSFFAYELWRALQGDSNQAAMLAIEQFKIEELPLLLQREREQGAAETRLALEQTAMDAVPAHTAEVEPARRSRQSPRSVAPANTDDQTLALLVEYEAQGGDRNDQTGAIKWLREQLGITYGPAHRRYKRVVAS